MAEGTSLLRMHTAYTCIVGSNPTASAKHAELKPHSVGLFFVCHRENAPIYCPAQYS